MDFDKFHAQHFEILCLLAHYKGCKHPRFQELFRKKVWLRGQQDSMPKLNEMGLLKYWKGEKVDYAKVGLQYSNNCEAYTHMIIILGKALIRRHEHELFKSFFISIRPLTELYYVEPFMIECFQYNSLECLIPIYALCSETHFIRKSHIFTNKSITKRDWDRECCNGNEASGVNLAQIQAVEQIKKAILLTNSQKTIPKHNEVAIRLTDFIKNAPEDLVDNLVQMLMDYHLLVRLIWLETAKLLKKDAKKEKKRQEEEKKKEISTVPKKSKRKIELER